jgi:hypothetical protein
MLMSASRQSAAVVFAAVLFAQALCPCLAEPEKAPGPGRAGDPEITFVMEMDAIREVDDFPRCQPGEHGEQLAVLTNEWRAVCGKLRPHITPERVRSLIKWFRKTTDGYSAVPALESAAFLPVTTDAEAGLLVLESTLDTLPSHSPLVTRWLKIFLVCNTKTGKIAKVIVTVRGELQE